MSSPIVPKLIPTKHSDDARGHFAKVLDVDGYGSLGFTSIEMFWTTSARGTVRGMHFQTPPFEVAKLVWVSSGRILDVAVDMRPGATFGELHVFEMSSSSQTLFIPAGFAHGFQSLEDDSRVNYAVDREYAPANDDGVRWDSVGVTWPLPAGPLSERDRGFVALEDFQSPFEAP